MLSATEQQEHILHHLENVKAFFMALFIASTGLVMSPSFLMQHLKILAGEIPSRAKKSQVDPSPSGSHIVPAECWPLLLSSLHESFLPVV